jgi:hypothetical protein
MDIACAPPHTTEVTPILAPLQKSAPQRIGNGTNAAIRASIDAAALANSGSDNDNDDNDGYSFFGGFPNPDPKDLLPRNICGNFIPLFVGSRKCQMSCSKKRKVKIFYDALTAEKKVILGNSPPREVKEKFNLWSQAVKQQGKWTLDRIAKSVFTSINQRQSTDAAEFCESQPAKAASNKVNDVPDCTG